jgi:hypothetical protein
MLQIIADAARRVRTVRVAPYVLVQPGGERRADLALIEEYAAGLGWHVTSSSFADAGQPLPLAKRAGFGAACCYAAQGYANGILAIARPAITTSDEAYAQILEHLHERQVFLAYLPAAYDSTA